MFKINLRSKFSVIFNSSKIAVFLFFIKNCLLSVKYYIATYTYIRVVAIILIVE